jgi:hypothetical protein
VLAARRSWIAASRAARLAGSMPTRFKHVCCCLQGVGGSVKLGSNLKTLAA